MIEFFNFISIIFDYLLTFFTLPLLVTSSLVNIAGFVNATAMAIHPNLGAFVTTYTVAVMFVSLLLPLLRDFSNV